MSTRKPSRVSYAGHGSLQGIVPAVALDPVPDFKPRRLSARERRERLERLRTEAAAVQAAARELDARLTELGAALVRAHLKHTDSSKGALPTCNGTGRCPSPGHLARQTGEVIP